jgi:hypothetical protein
MSIENGEAVEIVELPVVAGAGTPIPVPAEHVRPALDLSARIAELGILGVVVAVTPAESGHTLAMPAWSHLSRGAGDRVGFTADLADDHGIERTMCGLNAVCELVRRMREAADGLERVVNVTLKGLDGLGVRVVEAGEGEEFAGDEVTAPGSTEPSDVAG